MKFPARRNSHRATRRATTWLFGAALFCASSVPALGKDRAPIDLRRSLGNVPELAKKATEAIPGARLIELPNVGHIPHLEAPDAFYQAVEDFLRK